MFLKIIIKYLKEPYPYIYGNRKQLLSILAVIAILSFVFSYIFEPFEVNALEHKMSYFWIVLLHATLPIPIALLYFTLLNLFVKDDSRWTLGKEVFHLSLLLILIGIGSFLIRDLIYDKPDNWSLRYLYEEVRNSFFVGILLLAIVLPLNLQRLIQKHSKSLEKLKLQTPSKNNDSHIIKVASGNEIYQFDVQKFLFAKVESNYTEIYIHEDSQVKRALFRITLKELETQLKDFSNIYKTHRSYLVNLNKITACAGNAQGYQLSLKDYKKTVPVSRSKLEAFNEYFSHVSKS